MPEGCDCGGGGGGATLFPVPKTRPPPRLLREAIAHHLSVMFGKIRPRTLLLKQAGVDASVGEAWRFQVGQNCTLSETEDLGLRKGFAEKFILSSTFPNEIQPRSSTFIYQTSHPVPIMGRSFPEPQGGGSLMLAWQVRNRKVLVIGGGEVITPFPSTPSQSRI